MMLAMKKVDSIMPLRHTKISKVLPICGCFDYCFKEKDKKREREEAYDLIKNGNQ